MPMCPRRRKTITLSEQSIGARSCRPDSRGQIDVFQSSDYRGLGQTNNKEGKMLKKTINEPITQASSITENYGISIYKETEPYMKFVRDIEELKMIPNNVVFENMVCYVTDISTMYGEYEEEPIYAHR